LGSPMICVKYRSWMEDEIRYVPAGRYTTAGVVVEEEQPAPQRPPAEMAALMAAVSSVTPSPET
jgi:hypothetical protein